MTFNPIFFGSDTVSDKDWQKPNLAPSLTASTI